MSSITTSMLDSVREFVKAHHSKLDASHDWDHICRVVGLALNIARCEEQYGAKYDRRVLDLSAQLHDIADAKYPPPQCVDEKYHPHETVLQLLLGYGFPADIAEKVNEITFHVSYSKQEKNEIRQPGYTAEIIRKHPELAVLQDADRLDAIGAIGIGRCFVYAGTTGKGFKDVMLHFDEKLLKLAAGMQTETGKGIARKKAERLQEFTRWWEDEKVESSGSM